MENKSKDSPNTMEYPVNFSSLEMMNPERIGPTIPPMDDKIPKNPLKKSLVSGSVISKVKTL
jgi:hypothetical protein